MFDRKSKYVWLTAPGLEFRLVVLHFRWLRCASLAPPLRGRSPSPTLNLAWALACSFAPAGGHQSNLRDRCRKFWIDCKLASAGELRLPLHQGIYGHESRSRSQDACGRSSTESSDSKFVSAASVRAPATTVGATRQGRPPPITDCGSVPTATSRGARSP